ncbi:hypothetical protein CgS9114_01538, partial [Corynebacterium glutamicum S9114]
TLQQHPIKHGINDKRLALRQWLSVQAVNAKDAWDCLN